MVEATFPSCAIVRLPDDTVRKNLSQLSQLTSGEAYHNVDSGGLIAGSSIEGLSMFPDWGHPWPDIDFMYLYGAWLGVSLPPRSEPGSGPPRRSLASPPPSQPRFLGKGHGYIQCPKGYGSSCLEYAPEGCPPAYTRLRVTHKETLFEFPIMNPDCIGQDGDGQYWLHIVNIQKVIQRRLNENETYPANLTTSISGPAGEVCDSMNKYTALFMKYAYGFAEDQIISILSGFMCWIYLYLLIGSITQLFQCQWIAPKGVGENVGCLIS